VSQRAMARQFFGQQLGSWREPGFGHDPRWRSTAALRRLVRPEMRPAAGEADVRDAFVGSLPEAFGSWSRLAQDQYIEIRTLLSGYLLSAQGDRMLMGHSVAGRFPFLDRNVCALADSLPASYKLHVLDEKHVLKKAARGLVPEEILARTKQPYRAPDALAFAGEGAEWIDEIASEQAVRDAGVFAPALVQQLVGKCRSRAGAGQFSNSDNMALVGVLSSQIVYDRLIRRPLAHGPRVPIRTQVDLLAEDAAEPSPAGG
jgi:asparagine synthase (glutamine-hydrolysing)